MERSKMLPHDTDLEKYILGTLAVYGSAIDRIDLSPPVFYQEKHAIIFDAMVSIRNRAELVDLMSLNRELKKMGQLKRVGGAIYLANLTEAVTGDANLEVHARALYDVYARRKLITEAQRMVDLLNDPSTEYNESLNDFNGHAYEVIKTLSQRKGRKIGDVAMDWLDSLEEAANSDGSITGCPSGVHEFDRRTNGFQEPRLYIVAARPGMGKTDFGLNCVYNSALAGKPAALISLEMGDLELFSRMMSIHTGISKNVFEDKLKEHVAPEGFTLPEIVNGAAQIADMGIHLVDAGSMGAHELRRKCQELVKDGVELIVIDYLGLISLDFGSGRSKTDLLGDVSRMLKQSVAKELSVPVIALHQLSRAVENRGGDKRPILSDLRDSGEIEQDADMVTFLYRPEYYGYETDDNGDSVMGLCELIIKKNRQGKQGTVRANYNPEFGVFQEWVYYDNSSPF